MPHWTHRFGCCLVRDSPKKFPTKWRKQHAVANLQVDRDQLAALVAAARADGNNLALRGLLLGGVGDDDSTGRLRVGINTRFLYD
jgi:hypothetical protein